MVQYDDFKIIEGEAIAYEREYAFMKMDCTLIVLTAYPLTFNWRKHSPVSCKTHTSHNLVKDIFANKSGNNPQYIWVHPVP